MEKINFGYKPSRLDPRDYIYTQHVGLFGATSNLPSYYLPKRLPYSNDQLKFGICGGESGSYVEDYHFGGRTSPVYAYTKAKQLEGNVDEGVQPVSIAKVLTNSGVCRDELLPINVLTDVHQLPQITPEMDTDAATRKATSYAKVQTVDEIKHAIANGNPVLLAVAVLENFINVKDGVIPLPEGSWLGGHLLCGDGYDDNKTYTYPDGTVRKGFVRCPNSWGPDWGDHGYCWIPYDFFTYVENDGTDSHGQPITIRFFYEGWAVIAPNPVPSSTTMDEEITIQVNNNVAKVDDHEVTLDVAPKMEQNRVLVPIRFVAEALGLKVDWDEVSQIVKIRRG